MIPEPLRAILACPRCHGALRDTPTADGLVCPTCRLVYPVRDGIPVMVVDQATPAAPEQVS